MTTREYLDQAYQLNSLINSKIAHVEDLTALATKCSATLTGMPRNPNTSASRMSDTLAKIIDHQAEINRDIDRLVDLKQEIEGAIYAVENTTYQNILAMRYICFLPWEKIATDMHYSMPYVFRLHKKALDAVSVPNA